MIVKRDRQQQIDSARQSNFVTAFRNDFLWRYKAVKQRYRIESIQNMRKNRSVTAGF
jgi:hypothetical protein